MKYTKQRLFILLWASSLIKLTLLIIAQSLSGCKRSSGQLLLLSVVVQKSYFGILQSRPCRYFITRFKAARVNALPYLDT